MRFPARAKITILALLLAIYGNAFSVAAMRVRPSTKAIVELDRVSTNVGIPSSVQSPRWLPLQHIRAIVRQRRNSIRGEVSSTGEAGHDNISGTAATVEMSEYRIDSNLRNAFNTDVGTSVQQQRNQEHGHAKASLAFGAGLFITADGIATWLRFAVDAVLFGSEKWRALVHQAVDSRPRNLFIGSPRYGQIRSIAVTQLTQPRERSVQINGDRSDGGRPVGLELEISAFDAQLEVVMGGEQSTRKLVIACPDLVII